jgi:hypothetical protein
MWDGDEMHPRPGPIFGALIPANPALAQTSLRGRKRERERERERSIVRFARFSAVQTIISIFLTSRWVSSKWLTAAQTPCFAPEA